MEDGMEDGTTIKIKTENYVLLRTPILEEKIMRQQKAIQKIGVLQDGRKKL
jgi:hypothetical protein